MVRSTGSLHRIQYKLLLITYKALNNLPPSYLTDLLYHHSPSHRLRSADSNLLTPITRTKHGPWGTEPSLPLPLPP
ncbi:uncharacterized protein AKAME5_002530400 [Lates japonicus]|uniref:Uncharacterized protein n=1 Tax=Lates japonicus TaxID=270547 RepID=A0AAD3NJ41_LATJO|nr:uncharacterized protein AKAME5_002530400 [Lates japonicus]